MDNDMNLVVSDNKIKLPFFIKIILILMLVFVLFLLKYKIILYNIYDSKIIKGVEDYYVQVFIPFDNQIFLHDNQILIGNKKYNYEIIDISENYVDYENNKYMIVNIKTKLDEEYKVNNYYLQVKQKDKEKTLFNLIIDKIKKGMNLWMN